MKINKLKSHEFDYIGIHKNESKQYEMGRQKQKDKTHQRQNMCNLQCYIDKFEEQEEAIESKREEMLKKNERYMKQLRVKYRELKNLKL